MDSRPQTLVYRLVIAASKKVVRTARFDAAMSLGASSDGCRVGRLFSFVLQMWYESQVDRDGGIRMDGQDGQDVVMGWWWFGWRAPPSPGIPRSHSFARSRPFRAVRKGRGWCWFSGSAGKGCVGGSVGRAGLEPALTGWLTRCLVGFLGMDHSWSVVRRGRISVVGVSSSSSAGWRTFYSFWGQDPHFELTLSFFRWCGEG